MKMPSPRIVIWGVLLIFSLVFFGAGTCYAIIIPQVPDTQQPPTGSIGNPITNACAPISAVNVTEYWDVVVAHPNAFRVNAALIPNTAADYLYYFMDTNNWGSPVRLNGTTYPPTNGTYSADIMPGLFEYVRWDALNLFTTPPPPLPPNKMGYNWTLNSDFAVGFDFHAAAVDAGLPDVICFRYWNPINSGLIIPDPGGSGEMIQFYTWGPQVPGSYPPNPTEQWNLNYGQECIGHAVTGVGYFRNYDPDGPGPLPNTNWFICHDNWPTTGVNVALPWNNWAATITGDPGPAGQPQIVVAPDSIYHRQPVNVSRTYPSDFSVSNIGTANLTYNLSNTLSWVTFSTMGSTIPAGGADNVDVTVNTAGILPGTYVDIVTVNSNDPVNPVINKPKIVIEVYPDSLYWKDYNGQLPGGYMPDFDQKQDFTGDGFADIGYCGPVSIANSLWWFQGKYPQRTIIDPVFYPDNPQGFIQLLAMLMHTNMNGSMPPFQLDGTYVDSMQAGIETYLQMMGIGDLLYEHTIDRPTFHDVETEIERCQDVTLLLGFWVVREAYEIAPGQWMVVWARTGGHYVTSAGVNSEEHRIGVSDPYFDNFESGVSPGILRGFNHIHPAGHNDGISASHDIYGANDEMVCSPGGVWELGDAFWQNPGLQSEFYHQNGDTLLMQLPWPCPFPPLVGMLFSEVEAAVIVSPYEGIPDIDVVPDTLRYAQPVNINQTYLSQFAVCNTGTATLTVTGITCDLAFVSFASVPGIIAAGRCDSVDVIVNTIGVTPGLYTGACHVSSDDPDEPVVNEPFLRIQVTAPNVGVIPDSLYHLQIVNSIVMYPADFQIINSGDAPLAYNAVSAVPWITLAGMSGLIPPGGSDPISVTVNTNGIAPGTYVDIVTINSNDPDTPVLNKPKIVIQVNPLPVDSLYWKDYNGPAPQGYMPDFDQNQDFDGDQQVEIAYCGPTSVANSLWWFQGKYPQRPVVPPPFYPGNPAGFVEMLAALMMTNQGQWPGTSVENMQNGIDLYLQQMQLADLLYEHTIYQPTFEAVEEEIERCQDVTLLIGFWQVSQVIPGDPVLVEWVRVGGHYVTAAGVNSEDLLIGISDPDADNFEDGASRGVLRGVSHGHGGVPFRSPGYIHTPHNDGISASHDIYDVAIIPCSPAGLWELEGPYWHDPAIAFRYEYQNGGISPPQPAPWSPACPYPPIQGMVFAEIEAAIIVSPYEGVPDINVVPDSIYHSQLMNTSITYPDDFTIFNNGTAPLTYNASNTIPWITLSGMTGLIPAAGGDAIDITVNTSAVPVGVYVDLVTITSNDPDTPVLNKPKIVIRVTSEGPPLCDVVAGDANGNGTANGIDVTFMVNYFKGIGPKPPDTCYCPPRADTLFAAADGNGNCMFNGIDVTYMVNYFKGMGNAPLICGDCVTQLPPAVIPPSRGPKNQQ